MCKNTEMGLFNDLTTTFQSGRTKDLRWRAQQLRAIERMMSEREGDLINALRQDLGKPALESWMTEISYVSGEAAHCRKNLRRWARKTKVRTPAPALPGKSWVQPEPLGVVLVIGAWNYPLQLTLQSGQEATFLIELEGNIPVTRDTSFKIVTTNGAGFVGSVYLGHQKGGI